MRGNTIDFYDMKFQHQKQNEELVRTHAVNLYQQLCDSGLHPDDFMRGVFDCLIYDVVPQLSDEGVASFQTLMGFES